MPTRFSKKDSHLQKSLLLIRKNAQRLQRMISQLRDFQKIESGNFPLQLSKGDIFFFIHETVYAFREYALDRSIELVYLPEQEKMITWFDPDKLDKIIYNLLSNAFKFTPDGGKISVNNAIKNFDRSTDQPVINDKPQQSIEIRVQDSGIGISKNKIEHIFRPYYRVQDEKNEAKQPEGSGIGLSFVQELTKAYGGKITVNSDEGQGTEFIVCIPLDERYLEENQLVDAFTTGNLEILYPEDHLPDENPDSGDAEKVTDHQGDIPVILVVDDDQEIRNYIQSSLENKYRFLSAPNGVEGLKRADANIPDLIISDIKMPKNILYKKVNNASEIYLPNALGSDIVTSIKIIPIINPENTNNRIKSVMLLKYVRASLSFLFYPHKILL